MMRCKYCGHLIPDGVLRCERCGREVRIVPDYNPFEDELEAQVKGSIGGSTRQTHASRHTSPGSSIRVRQAERERERERARLAKKRRKTNIIRTILLLLVIASGTFVYVYYQESYTGQVKKGDKALVEKNYDEALNYYQNAMQKDDQRKEAYEGLSKIYIAQENYTAAEEMFRNAIAKYPDSVDIYQATIDYYMEIDQEFTVSEIMNQANDYIRKELKKYVSSTPEFSLDDTVTYDDVQQLALTSDGDEIYYTMDGSEPVAETAEKYSEPIQLGEGETHVKAISVNDAGVPSYTVEKIYVVELPIEEAPAVTPSTGQYDMQMQIVIKVPAGYTAYYTMDGTDPDTSSSIYTGVLNMPMGSTIFKAVLVNSKGRMSSVTTRNYELIIE